MSTTSIMRGIVVVLVVGALSIAAICRSEESRPVGDVEARAHLAAWYRGEVHDPSVAAWRRAALISSAADLISTEIALSRCGSTCAEGNPFLGRTRAQRIAAKAASGALVALLSRHYQRRHPGRAKAILGAGIAFHTGLTVNAVCHW